MRKFIFVVGPTASGKSQWALAEAQKNQGVIFNCDSVQLYKKVQVGAAKPSLKEQKLVPHYLFDLISPPDEVTSAGYRRLFFESLQEISAETPVYVVGGTGFYFLALEKGLFEIQEASPEIKLAVANELTQAGGVEKLLAEVRSKDPEHANKLHVNDHYRIGRAVEILRTNPATTITELFEQKKNQKGLEGEIKKVGMKWTAEELEVRIRQRTRKMLAEGLIEETQNLLNEGLEDWAPLRSVGYKETVQFIRGEIDQEQLEEQIVIATRQLAKKQRTWFQRDAEIQWVDGAKFIR